MRGGDGGGFVDFRREGLFYLLFRFFCEVNRSNDGCFNYLVNGIV